MLTTFQHISNTLCYQYSGPRKKNCITVIAIFFFQLKKTQLKLSTAQEYNQKEKKEEKSMS